MDPVSRLDPRARSRALNTMLNEVQEGRCLCGGEVQGGGV